jgi:hypothetical protein
MAEHSPLRFSTAFDEDSAHHEDTSSFGTPLWLARQSAGAKSTIFIGTWILEMKAMLI